MAVCSRSRLEDKEKVIHVNKGAALGTWIMEASNMGTGSVYDWMRKILFDFEEDTVSIEAMNEALNNSTAGADGIIAWPYLGRQRDA